MIARQHPPTHTSDAERIGGLDSVRALAALSVMLTHILVPNLEGLLSFTPLAGTAIPALSKYIITGIPVITFFVVSGFCIHYPYQTKSLPVLSFLAARWIRLLLPTLVAIMVAMIAKLATYNFWDGYILWSIVCELFYYTLYPLFFWLSRFITFRAQYLLSLMVSLGLALYLGSDAYGNFNNFGPELNWLISLPSWLLGCVLAESVFQKRQRQNLTPHKDVPIVVWRAMVAIAASLLLWLSFNTPAGLYLTLHLFALLSYFWIAAEIRLQRVAGNKLEAIGRWSFSLYLMHMPIYAILGRIMLCWTENPTYYQLLGLPIVLWFSYVFYRAMEMPTHTYARHLFKTVQPRGILISSRKMIQKVAP